MTLPDDIDTSSEITLHRSRNDAEQTADHRQDECELDRNAETIE